MQPARYTADEVVRRGEALYEQRIRSEVEGAHSGEYLVLDIETGDHRTGRDYHLLSHELLGSKPDAALCVLRIGSPVVGRIGGRLSPAR